MISRERIELIDNCLMQAIVNGNRVPYTNSCPKQFTICTIYQLSSAGNAYLRLSITIRSAIACKFR